jgi:hypothetical protein
MHVVDIIVVCILKIRFIGRNWGIDEEDYSDTSFDSGCHIMSGVEAHLGC